MAGSTAASNFAVLIAPAMRGGLGNAMAEVTSISTGAGRSGGGGGGGDGDPTLARGPGGRAGMFGGQLTIVSLVDAGKVVSKGDVVAEFDREEMQTRLDDFRSRVSQTETGMATLRAQLEVLEKNHAQTVKAGLADVDKARLDLKTLQVRSEIDSEKLKLAYEQATSTQKQLMVEVPMMEQSLQSQWRLALLARDEGLAELKRTQTNVDRMTLKAPLSGLVVMMTTFRPGNATAAQIKAGDQVRSGSPVMRIVDLNSMIVNANVNQVDAEQMRIGAKAEVRFDAYPDLQLPAVVYSIAAVPAAGQFRPDYLREVAVSLKLLRLDKRVIPDLSVSADVLLETVPQTVIAPKEAIFRDAPDGKPFVFLQQPEGWVRREVELGKGNYVAAAVRSGLRAGDTVAGERPKVEKAQKQ